MSLQTFTCFLGLPKELQIQIWRFAIESANKDAEVWDLSNYAAGPENLHYDNLHYPLLESPFSKQRIYAYLLGGFPGFFRIMNSCRWSRLVALEYWYGQVKRGRAGPSYTRTYREWLRENVLVVLEECIVQVKQTLER